MASEIVLECLSVRDFRNFKQLELRLRPNLNFFLGENGQGKTNIIEAVHLLCRGVSFRPAEASSLLRHASRQNLKANGGSGVSSIPLEKVQDEICQRGRIAGAFSRSSLDYLVEIVLENGKKTSFINGKRANTAALVANFPCVLFSPESLAAIKEGPDARRTLIDEILLNHEPRQAHILREYSRALRSRNRLLRNLANHLGPRRETEESLESLNRIYFILSTHLTVARTKALRDIEPWLRRAMSFISEETIGDISVDYLISSQSALTWSDSEVYDALLKRHKDLSYQEVRSGSSLIGPHKHDIKLLVGGNDSRFYCSQGQQRAVILALKIAQIVYHHEVHQTYPILLLDDVLSELDMKKRTNLMKFLESIAAQILITSTELTAEEARSSKINADRNLIFTVADGQVGQSTVEQSRT